MTIRFSPKILGLNAGIFGTVFEQSMTDSQIVLGLFLLFFFFCVIAKKMNNMLVV